MASKLVMLMVFVLFINFLSVLSKGNNNAGSSFNAIVNSIVNYANLFVKNIGSKYIETVYKALDDSNRPPIKIINHEKDEVAHINDSRLLVHEVSKKIRVLCWVLMYPANHFRKAIHVKNTWGKRCNKLLFMSTAEEPSLPTIILPVKGEGRNFLWAKTKAAFRYVYEHYRRDADWFVKADDDTYVIVDNLRYMLVDYNTSDPIFFGCLFKPYDDNMGFMSGGAGYVLSREALRRFVDVALALPHACSTADDGDEDVQIGRCLGHVGVKAMDSRDSLKRARFLPFPPRSHIMPRGVNASSWLWSYLYYPFREGRECCSDHAISFHYIRPDEMYMFDLLIYHIRPYGNKLTYAAPSIPDIDPNDRKESLSASNESNSLEDTANERGTLRLQFYPEAMRDLNKHPIMSAAYHDKHEPASRSENCTLDVELAKKVRVLCWIMTYPDNHKTKAQHVKATWGKRCNKLIFMSSKEDPSLPTVKLPLRHEGRDYLWAKTKAAFRYVYKHHRGDADWFMKADDDTYVIVENLRCMLADYNTTDALYFGYEINRNTAHGYMSGGAGYVLSRVALHRFVNYGLPSPHLCEPSDGGAEDVEMGKCLKNIGVKAIDSRDSLKRGYFIPIPEEMKIFYFHPDDRVGLECCSERTVSFHYVRPEEMYVLDHFIYDSVTGTPENGTDIQLFKIKEILMTAIRPSP